MSFPINQILNLLGKILKGTIVFEHNYHFTEDRKITFRGITKAVPFLPSANCICLQKEIISLYIMFSSYLFFNLDAILSFFFDFYSFYL